MAANNELKKGIKLMSEGKEEGFNIVYTNTYDFVYKRAKYIMQNEDDALDLVQETYVQAYKGIGSMEKADNIYAWLGAVVYNQGMRIFRSRKEILLDEEAEGIFDDIVDDDIDTKPEDSFEVQETTKIVKDMIDELPELQRAAVMAFYYDNMKIDDIAKQFGCSSNTIKSRLNYAKKYLKDSVEAHEKKNGYKLHSVTPFIIVLALRGLFAETAYAAEGAVMNNAYGEICKKVGMNGSTTAVANGASVVVKNAAKTGLSLGAKLGIAAAVVAVVAGVGVGVAKFGGSGSDSGNQGDKQIEDGSIAGNQANDEAEDSNDENLSGLNYYMRERDADGTYIFVNSTGTLKLEDDVSDNIYDGYYIYVTEDGKGIKNLNGKITVEPGTYEEMDWMDSQSQSDIWTKQFHTILLVKGEDGYGVIDAKGNVIIDLIYDSIEYIECGKLDKTSYYRIICNETSDPNNVKSTAFKSDGTKIFELEGELINDDYFEEGDSLYEKVDADGKVVGIVSTKSGQVLFDFVKDGIEKVFYMNEQIEVSYTDGSKKYFVFNEDFTSYTESLWGDDFDVLITSQYTAYYKYFDRELHFYLGDELVKTVTGVEEAWVCNDKVYYIERTWVDNEDGGEKLNYTLYDYDGVVIDSKYTLHFTDSFAQRHIIISEENEQSYQLFDLDKREVVATGIVSTERVYSNWQYYSLQLENGELVTIWNGELLFIHEAEREIHEVFEEHVLWNKGAEKDVITDLEGNVLFEFDEELHMVDPFQQLVLDVSGDTRAYYNFEGELVYEVEK